MTVATSMISKETTAAASPPRFHMFLGIMWLALWMGNFLRSSYDLFPISPYYVVAALYIPYFVFLRPADVIRVAGKPLFWIWFLTALLPIFMYLNSGGGEYAYVEVRTRITYFSAVAGTAVLLSSHRPRQTLQIAVVLVIVIASLINLVELVVPLGLSEAVGRSAGFHQNPNASAGVLVACLLVALDFQRQTFRGLALATLTAFGVLATFSRHGSLAIVAIWLAYLLAARGKPRESISAPSRLLLLLGGILGGIIAVWGLLNFFDLHFEASLRIRSLLGLSLADPAAQGRLDNASYGLQLYLESPWTGLGLGSHSFLDLATHNTFLQLGINYGIVAILMLLLILTVNTVGALRQRLWMGGNLGLLVGFFVYEAFFSQTLERNLAFACIFGALLARVFDSDETLNAPEPPSPRFEPNEHFEVRAGAPT